jgi:hypothetical protein
MKKYTETDYVMMKMQMLGNDRLAFGFAKHYDTEVEMYEDLIANLQERLEEAKNNPDEPSKYGYRVELEAFKKGEPTNRF